MLEQLVLYLFASLVLVGGLMAALTRQILYAIIGLGLGIAHLLANVISRPLKEVTRQQKRVWKQI